VSKLLLKVSTDLPNLLNKVLAPIYGWGLVMLACNLSYLAGTGRRMLVQGQSLAKVRDPIKKQTKTKKKAGGVAGVV
jgi:hypothetical protein